MAQLITDKNTLINILPEIIREQFNIKITDIKYIGGGSYGIVFLSQLDDGEKIIFKAYRVSGMNETEAFQLRFLSDNTYVRMPKVLFTYNSEDMCLLAMSFIEGKNVLNPAFLFKSKRAREKFALDVIKGAHCWHDVKGEKFGDAKNPLYDSWYDCYRVKKVNDILEGLKKLTDEKKFSEKRYILLKEATDIFDKIYDEPECSSLIHGDLNIMNIMADPKTFELKGIIDPYGSMFADAEYDLFQLQNMWGNQFYLFDTYKRLYETSKHCDFKVAYYGAVNEASCRLGDGLIFPLWEDLWISRLKREIKKYR